MKLNKHNKKGMTLAECIIAIALLGAMSAMLVSIAVAAKRQNRDNYFRSGEMYAQAARIESYNPSGSYSSNHIKVTKLMSSAAGASGNTFNLVADFGTYKLDTITYGYRALPTGEKDKKANYTLKTLKSVYDSTATITPSIGTGFYILKIYNFSGTELDLDISVPDTNGGTFTNELGSIAGPQLLAPLAEGSIYIAGFQATSSDVLFTITDGSGYTIPVTRGNYTSWMEYDDTYQPTGYFYFYFTDDGDVVSKADYDALYGS